MTSARIATREERLAARIELLAEEKELTRREDELACRRQALPRVRADEAYAFDTNARPKILPELFGGRSQAHDVVAPDLPCDDDSARPRGGAGTPGRPGAALSGSPAPA